jgi:hypothetical protein
MAYYEQIKTKKANTQRLKKTSNREFQRLTQNHSNKRKKRIQSPLINDNEDDELEEDVQLFIIKRNEAVNDIVGDDNTVDK